MTGFIGCKKPDAFFLERFCSRIEWTEFKIRTTVDHKVIYKLFRMYVIWDLGNACVDLTVFIRT